MLLQSLSKMRELVDKLNRYRNSHYNHHQSLVTDAVYDALYDQLLALEIETNTVYANSPTTTVGYEVVTELQKVVHTHPMLSLDKTKSVDDVVAFGASKPLIAMLKLDGLTVALIYEDGHLVQANTRGNGIEGCSVLHNALTIINIPKTVSTKKRLEISGEVIITLDEFKRINDPLPVEEQYDNIRNLASGSLQQLDSSIAAQRHMMFIAWDCVEGTNSPYLSNTLFELAALGFTTTPFFTLTATLGSVEETNTDLQTLANAFQYPIDGIVYKYDDIPYAKSLGATSHHSRAGLAFKFYDEIYPTRLKEVEWSVGGTGVITPVAYFEPVFIEGTIERASLHNISIMEELGLTNGCTVNVYKANKIIPQIDSCENDGDGQIVLPNVCPSCGLPISFSLSSERKVLMCTNKVCPGQLVKQLSRFVGKSGMDIDGLSEATLTILISLGWVKQFVDIYTLAEHSIEMRTLKGFGDKSVDGLLLAIENSKTVSLDKFLAAFSIPLIGRSASKKIALYCRGDIDTFYNAMETEFDWTQLEDIGDVQSSNLTQWYSKFQPAMKQLSDLMNFTGIVQTSNNALQGLSFCITGSLQEYSNRESLEQDIINFGGTVVSGVSKKTSYLLTNDKESGSSKNKKANELQIPIITELQFKEMISKT